MRKGRLIGYNTDAFGLECTLQKNAVDVYGKTVMILGTGGTSLTARFVAKKLGARNVLTVGRTSALDYTTCYLRSDVNVIVNATPVGTFPDGGVPIDLTRFPALTGVVDVTYNPLRTPLLRQAKEMRLQTAGGLAMLVAQAVRSAEIFTDGFIDDFVAERVYRELRAAVCGVAFIGMPGAGKTTFGRKTADLLGKRFIDTDDEVEKRAGKSVSEIFAQDGEAAFRALEEQAVRAAADERNAVISVGGGAVLSAENRSALRENAVILYVKRDAGELETANRPLSRSPEAVGKIEREREPIYRDLADFTIENRGDADEVFQKIKEILQ